MGKLVRLGNKVWLDDGLQFPTRRQKMLFEMYGIVSRFVVLALCQRTGKSTDLFGVIGFRKMLVRLR